MPSINVLEALGGVDFTKYEHYPLVNTCPTEKIIEISVK